ncbi:MAG: zinc-ribbon domain-containing protein [Lachnospiraceae bacterium]|nr:zinc-ribbon domain-containing protein [Lachnospiraceae bacterium]
MRKEREFTAVVVENRNELIDATSAKSEVVLIQGDALEKLRKEMLKEKKNNSRSSAFSKVTGAGAVSYLIPSAIASLPAAVFLGITALIFAALGYDSENLKKYDMFQLLDSNGNISALGLVLRNEYVPEDDLITSPYQIALFSKNKCPKCGHKFNSKYIFGTCPKCKVTLSRIGKLK